jgi:hypothetical protein
VYLLIVNNIHIYIFRCGDSSSPDTYAAKRGHQAQINLSVFFFFFEHVLTRRVIFFHFRRLPAGVDRFMIPVLTEESKMSDARFRGANRGQMF